MNQSLLDTIAAEVRDFMKTVSELEYICIVGVTTSRVKYKTVLHMLEDKLGISHDQLSSQKDQIKAIIKDETIKEFRERIEKNSKQDMASEFYPTEDYSGLIDRPVESGERQQWNNAYATFYNERNTLVQSQNPSITQQEVAKIIETSWRALPTEDKQRYLKLSELESTFPQDLEERSNLYIKARHDRDSLRKEKEIGLRSIPLNTMSVSIPKKARSAYIFYCLKHRSRIQEQNDSISPVEVSRRLGAEWNSLTTEEKEPYKKMESDDRLRYMRELADLGLTPDDVKRCNRNSTASASRAKSAYLYFCSLKREEIRAQNGQLSSNDVNKQLNMIWSNMTDEERAPYEESAFDDKERIKREVEKVRQSIKEPIVLPVPKPKRAKRARTPYTLFYKEQMAHLREENENIPFGEISKKLADAWKSMPEERKQVYIERSHQEQEALAPPVDTTKKMEDLSHLHPAFLNYQTRRMIVLKHEKPDADEEALRSIIANEWMAMDEASRLSYLKNDSDYGFTS